MYKGKLRRDLKNQFLRIKIQRMTKKINQNQLIGQFISKNKKRKLTTYEITTMVNKGLPRGVKKLTPIQVSKCLSRFSIKGVVKIADSNGVHPKTGLKANRWTYSA
jgi:hypothetical protein